MTIGKYKDKTFIYTCVKFFSIYIFFRKIIYKAIIVGEKLSRNHGKPEIYKTTTKNIISKNNMNEINNLISNRIVRKQGRRKEGVRGSS